MENETPTPDENLNQPTTESSSSSSTEPKKPTTETKSTKKSKSSTKKKKKTPKPAKKKTDSTPKQKEEPSYFNKYDVPNASWFERQMKSDTTRDLHVVEFFHLLATRTTDDERILLLRRAKNDPALMTLLNMNYSRSTYSMFEPTEKSMDEFRLSKLPWGLNPYTLRAEYKRIRYLMLSSPDGQRINNQTREKIFYEFMESLYPAEARILFECVTGTLNVPGIEASHIRKAFGKSRFPEIKE